MINHKYALVMKDHNTGEWKIICTSGNKDYLETIAKQLVEDGESVTIEAVVDQDISV